MEKIKLLIVDDVEDNRLVLKAICRKLEGFDIYEAVDGRDALDQCETLRPHIVLMDVMMPRLDGFQASKLIKERYPDTVVMAVTAVIDPKMEENMASIGVAAYIRKPIDKELLRLKLQSYAGALLVSGHENKKVSKVGAINPFCNEIRNFKTIFSIDSMDAIMDFGTWLLVRFECAHVSVCSSIDMIIELLYALLRQEIKNGAMITITIEENFDELFIHAPLLKPVERDQTMEHLIHTLGQSVMVSATMAAFRIRLIPSEGESSSCQAAVHHEPMLPKEECLDKQEVATRSMGAIEHQVLRESFVNKITASEYIAGIDQDAYGEIRDLHEAEEEWKAWLYTLETEPSEEHFYRFADEVLSVYANAISALYEFSGLSYAMVSLSTLIKTNGALLASDEAKRANVLMFLEGFKNDIASWTEHVFELQDAQDIHYLDGSFFSSCMIIESIITGVEVDTGEEGEIEFF